MTGEPDAIELTVDEYAAIDSATPYQAGNGVCLDEALMRAEARTNAWLTAKVNDRPA